MGMVPPVTQGDYTVVSALGREEVRHPRTWRGRCDKSASDVIIRIYQLKPGSPELDPLTREAMSMASLTHTNIQEMLSVFPITEAFQLWIVSPFANRGSLGDQIRNKYTTGLPDSATLHVLGQALQALSFLHSHKVPHRDVQPDNMLIDSNYTVRLSEPAVLMPSAKCYVRFNYWTAPEVLQTGVYTVAADIWALGMSAVELACGSNPFTGMAPHKVLISVAELEPPSIPASRATILELRSLAQLCLVRSPSNRASAAQLIESIVKPASVSSPFVPWDLCAPALDAAAVEAGVDSLDGAPPWMFRSEDFSLMETVSGFEGAGAGDAADLDRRAFELSSLLDLPSLCLPSAPTAPVPAPAPTAAPAPPPQQSQPQSQAQQPVQQPQQQQQQQQQQEERQQPDRSNSGSLPDTSATHDPTNFERSSSDPSSSPGKMTDNKMRATSNQQGPAFIQLSSPTSDALALNPNSLKADGIIAANRPSRPPGRISESKSQPGSTTNLDLGHQQVQEQAGKSSTHDPLITPTSKSGVEIAAAAPQVVKSATSDGAIAPGSVPPQRTSSEYKRPPSPGLSNTQPRQSSISSPRPTIQIPSQTQQQQPHGAPPPSPPAFADVTTVSQARQPTTAAPPPQQHQQRPPSPGTANATGGAFPAPQQQQQQQQHQRPLSPSTISAPVGGGGVIAPEQRRNASLNQISNFLGADEPPPHELRKESSAPSAVLSAPTTTRPPSSASSKQQQPYIPGQSGGRPPLPGHQQGGGGKAQADGGSTKFNIKNLAAPGGGGGGATATSGGAPRTERRFDVKPAAGIPHVNSSNSVSSTTSQNSSGQLTSQNSSGQSGGGDAGVKKFQIRDPPAATAASQNTFGGAGGGVSLASSMSMSALSTLPGGSGAGSDLSKTSLEDIQRLRGDVFRAAGEMGARLEALAAQNEALRTARDQLVLLVEKSSALLDFYKTDNVGV